jgi:hypothetical protein
MNASQRIGLTDTLHWEKEINPSTSWTSVKHLIKPNKKLVGNASRFHKKMMI